MIIYMGFCLYFVLWISIAGSFQFMMIDICRFGYRDLTIEFLVYWVFVFLSFMFLVLQLLYIN